MTDIPPNAFELLKGLGCGVYMIIIFWIWRRTK
jgi:hypothetical protein